MIDAEQLRRAAVYSGIMGSHGTQVPMHKLEAFANILLAEENEACASACEQAGIEGMGTLAAAASIRERRKA